MNTMKCPNCSATMSPSDDPDVTVDVCPGCGGRFFDKGELNEFATGIAGDVEGRSLIWTDVVHAVEHVVPVDKLPQRSCSRCDGEPMKKVGLVTFVGIVFDFCPKCEGFFLDVGEVKSMNRKLKEYSGDGLGDEYRNHHQGLLVRGNMYFGGTNAPPFLFQRGIATATIETKVYFNRPLDLGLHVYPERWPAKLAKAFGLFGKQDIVTGDAEFDSAFIIQGNDGEKVKKLLSPEVQKAALRFVSTAPRFFSHPGPLQIFDYCVCYTEGPYSGKADINWRSPAAATIIDGLVSIATAME
ncbi:MAG: zf-TFIIB domain-containing protein [Pirellulales bacterium]|nr:zf-TFIIB domain-containing protein [Pirellulales bacterium]